MRVDKKMNDDDRLDGWLIIDRRVGETKKIGQIFLMINLFRDGNTRYTWIRVNQGRKILRRMKERRRDRDEQPD